MSSVYKIDLPPLPDSIIEQAKSGKAKTHNAISLETSGRIQQLIDFQLPIKVNICNYMFATVPEWNEQLNAIYGKFFSTPMVSLYAVMEARLEKPSCFTPHTDRLRRHAINYVIDTGGIDVSTKFYKLKSGEPTVNENFPTRGKDYKYLDLELIDSFVFEPNNWYLFDPQVIHTVENITGRRVFVGLTLENNLPLNELLTKYSHLIKTCHD
jgi:hypothetical protein